MESTCSTYRDNAYSLYITGKVFFVHATEAYRKSRYFSTHSENLYYMNDSDQVDTSVTLHTLWKYVPIHL